MNNDNYGDSRQLIDDIITPKFRYHDERLERVKYQSIGVLEDNYFLNKYVGARRNDYTRIPPLRDIEIGNSAAVMAVSQFVGNWQNKLKHIDISLKARLETLTFTSLITSGTLRLPRKYTISHGLHLNWQDQQVKRLRWLAPLLLLATCGIILAILTPWDPTNSRMRIITPKAHPSITRQTDLRSNKSSTEVTHDTSASSNGITPLTDSGSGALEQGNSQGTASPESSIEPPSNASPAAVSSESSTPSASSGASGSSPSSSSVSGSGSGSSGGSGSGSSSGGILQLTIPPESVNVDGKTILSTASISVN